MIYINVFILIERNITICNDCKFYKSVCYDLKCCKSSGKNICIIL